MPEQTKKQDNNNQNGTQNGVKADLLVGAVPSSGTADLKGSPPQGGESGKLGDLRGPGPSYLAKHRAAAAAQNQSKMAEKFPKEQSAAPKAPASTASTAAPSSTASSLSSARSRESEKASNRKSTSSDRSRNSSYAQQGTHGASLGHQRNARPWQALGDSEVLALDIEQPDECVELQNSPPGLAECTHAKDQVLVIEKASRVAAWAALKKEFDVQKMIWESVALMKKAQMAASGRESQATKEPAEIILLKEFETILNKKASDPAGAVAALEEILSKDAKEYNLLSKSMRDFSLAAIFSEDQAKKRRALMDMFEASPKTPRKGKETDTKLEELSKLLTDCDLGRSKAAYNARRILSWRLGAPESGTWLPLSSAWAFKDEDAHDPWAYDLPDASISPPPSAASAEADKEFRRARTDLSSLGKKNKVKEKARPSVSTPRAEPPPDEPGPKHPPPARLVLFPRYSASEPLSIAPVACYPTGLQNQGSTSAGGSDPGRPATAI